MKELIEKLASGDDVALRILNALSENDKGAEAINVLQSAGVYGMSIYILWSDRCYKDATKFYNLLTSKVLPTRLLELSNGRELTDEEEVLLTRG